MKTDSLFYRLFQERPDLVFELAEWSPPAGVRYTLHAEDVKQTGFRLDGILPPTPSDRTDLPLFFLEAQFQTDNDFYALCWRNPLHRAIRRRGGRWPI